MTLRDACDAVRLHAHQVLDRVRAGLPVADDIVRDALLVLGEPAL